jgi:hypothetical protein
MHHCLPSSGLHARRRRTRGRLLRAVCRCEATSLTCVSSSSMKCQKRRLPDTWQMVTGMPRSAAMRRRRFFIVVGWVPSGIVIRVAVLSSEGCSPSRRCRSPDPWGTRGSCGGLCSAAYLHTRERRLVGPRLRSPGSPRAPAPIGHRGRARHAFSHGWSSRKATRRRQAAPSWCPGPPSAPRAHPSSYVSSLHEEFHRDQGTTLDPRLQISRAAKRLIDTGDDRAASGAIQDRRGSGG